MLLIITNVSKMNRCYTIDLAPETKPHFLYLSVIFVDNSKNILLLQSEMTSSHIWNEMYYLFLTTLLFSIFNLNTYSQWCYLHL